MKLQLEYKIIDDYGEEKVKTKTISNIEEVDNAALSQFAKAYYSLLDATDFNAYLITKTPVNS